MENIYVLLGLDLHNPSRDAQIILQAASEMEGRWSHMIQNGIEGSRQTLQAKKGLESLDEIRAIASDPIRLEQQAREAAEILETLWNEFQGDVSLLDLSGEISETDRRDLIRRYPLLNLNTKNIEDNIQKALGGRLDENAGCLDTKLASRIVRAAENYGLDSTSLYAFLDCEEKAENTEILEHMEEKRKARLQDSGNAASAVQILELLDLCQLVFPERRAEYDRWLAGNRYPRISARLKMATTKDTRILSQRGYDLIYAQIADTNESMDPMAFYQYVLAWAEQQKVTLQVFPPQPVTVLQPEPLKENVLPENERQTVQDPAPAPVEAKETCKPAEKSMDPSEALIMNLANKSLGCASGVISHYETEFLKETSRKPTSRKLWITAGAAAAADIVLFAAGRFGLIQPVVSVPLLSFLTETFRPFMPVAFMLSTIAMALCFLWADLVCLPLRTCVKAAFRCKEDSQKLWERFCQDPEHVNEAQKWRGHFEKLAKKSNANLVDYNKKLEAFGRDMQRSGTLEYPGNFRRQGIVIALGVHGAALLIMLC